MSDIGIALKKDEVFRVGKHGYDIRKMSRAAWEKEQREFEASGFKIRCVICNEETRKVLGTPIFYGNIFTINNKIPYGIVYFNSPF